MTDLLQVLPDLDTRPFSHLLPSLDKALVATNDLVVLEPADVAKRAQLPPADVRRLADAVVLALHRHLGFGAEEAARGSDKAFLSASESASGDAPAPEHRWGSISTLDEQLDAALGGGFRSGYLAEVTGESGAGKTQLLLTLLLASQLPAPHGLSRSAVYISTEAALATTRLTQLLSSHPSLAPLPRDQKPSLSRILSIQTPDLESQEHILRYQLPVAIKKHNVGLVVLDSVAANFRAEFEKQGAKEGAAAMAKRGAQLVQLGALLRHLARTEGIAVVVANQVADRFAKAPSATPSNAPSRTTSGNSQNGDGANTPHQQTSNPPSQTEGLIISPDALALDHQQCWFTGWGDVQSDPLHTLKTPSLGLVWTNQIACRIALSKRPVYARRPLVVTVNGEDQWNEDENHISKWRRWLKVVFAPWAPPTEGRGIEYEVLKNGIRHVSKDP
ncbi:P-loop containing nucleoside triphosphate hydrolase protein [Lentithecium fluviatile CBS 122367]|uniref:P-loop containing nucleoside triphosphate hydrolase protein n=1 Tax=Lentithecium fluviatile CBS 122367 TaxID=1168545 RepID=A0A6G1JES3_9PLEO|nr:P-loop containing nucleoside triphosphate hydrolase protein [Lentithecium fluviatile CBS 122367]